MALRNDVTALFDGRQVGDDEVLDLNTTLRRIERFFSEQVQFRV